MAETVISRASEDVLELATSLIDEHHEDLLDARILWLFTTAKRSKANRVVLGTANRTTVLTRYLSGMATDHPADFIVLVDGKRWSTMLATQKAACIDSCLCRMRWRETVNERSGKVSGRWITVGPDIEEFSEVLERHGAWLPEQARLVKIIRDGKQLRFDEHDLARGIRGADVAEDQAANENAVERITTVAPDGIVESTEIVGGADSAAPPVDVDDETAHNGHHEQLEVDGENWRTSNGIGTSPLEVRRARRRGTASSEQPATVPS